MATEEFALARIEYQAQRDLVLVAVREGKLEHAHEAGLHGAFEALSHQFDARYHALTRASAQDDAGAKAFLRAR